VFGKAGHQIARITDCRRALAQAAMNDRMKLRQSPQRRMDSIGLSDKLANPGRLGFIEIEFRNIGRVEVHGVLT
jgi:hypothetical protein